MGREEAVKLSYALEKFGGEKRKEQTLANKAETESSRSLSLPCMRKT